MVNVALSPPSRPSLVAGITTKVTRSARRWASGKVLGGIGMLVFFVLVGNVGPLVLRGSPTAPTSATLLPPSGAHWLGTTLQGQDVFRQLVDGTNSSLEVGFAAGILATLVAVVVGLSAGYFRGLGGEMFSALSNVFLVLPSLPLVIVLAGYLPRTGALSIMVVIAVTSWAGGARIIRAQALATVERDYVYAAKALGEPTRRILFSEILPNLSTIVMSTFLFAVIAAIATEAGLAFLGLGNVNQVSWGYMINLAQSNDAVLGGAWWWWLPPGICYALVGAALGLINFGMDELGNPRLRAVKVNRAQRGALKQTGLHARAGRGETVDRGAGDDRGEGEGAEASAVGSVVAGDVESPLLEVQDLRVGYATERGMVEAVRGVSFTLQRGEMMGIAGESGSGKSTVAHAITRLIHPPGTVLGGSVLCRPEPPGAEGPGVQLACHGAIDILALGPEELRAFRWEKMAIVFQSAMNALNPVMSILAQLVDVIEAHRPALGRPGAEDRAYELLGLVGVPVDRCHSFPHELSGGMRQRVMIGMALALEPALLILDEPTTGLDVVVQRAILARMLELRRRLGFSVIFITHDLSLLLEMCDSVLVMYGGRAVEIASATQLRSDPLHPYTKGLRDAFPPLHGAKVRLTGIPGLPPDLSQTLPGCPFEPRCPHAFEPCATELPVLRTEDRLSGGLARVGLTRQHAVRCHLYSHTPQAREGLPSAKDPPSGLARPGPVAALGLRLDAAATPVLEARHLTKHYRLLQGRRVVRAVEDVSLAVQRKQVAAIVGESGSGKSTFLRLLARLVPATSGDIILNGHPVVLGNVGRQLAYRSEVQLVFQDPFASLNPARSVGYQVERALCLHGDLPSHQERVRGVAELLKRVSLSPAERFLGRFPYEMSGGQRQRVAIARALAVRPSVLLADEPVSMLDVSMQVDVLNLLDDLRTTSDLGVVYVTHNIASARYIADVMYVMYAGALVEGGPPLSVAERPAHPYTQLLMSSAPDPERAGGTGADRSDEGGALDMARAPSGCRFHPRCPFATARCKEETPPVFSVDATHWAKCWLLEAGSPIIREGPPFLSG